MKNIFISLFAIILLCGCERQEEITVDVPYKKKLVAEVFLGEGDSIFTANLSYTKPVFGAPNTTEPWYATNAKAHINIKGNIYGMAYNEFTFNFNAEYQSNIIKAGETYYFQASDESETITGFTQIPEKPTFDFDIKFDSSLTDFYYYNAVIKCTNKSLNTINAKFVAQVIFSDSSKVFLTEITSSKIQVLKQNESITKKLYTYKPNEFVFPVRIECYGVNCNDEYTKYSNATSIFNFSNILPVSEPTIAYSNMSNKIGIIAAYSLSEPKIFNLQ